MCTTKSAEFLPNIAYMKPNGAFCDTQMFRYVFILRQMSETPKDIGLPCAEQVKAVQSSRDRRLSRNCPPYW